MRITNLVANIKSLGETIDDTRVVKKFLRVVPPRFNQVAVSIEMFCEMKTLTVEDLVGRLRAAEDRFEDKVEHITDKAGRLLLAEDEWLEKHKHRFQANSHREGSSGGSGASNHMTGTRSALAHLDENVRGSVRFVDGSSVEICGLGAVVIQGRHDQHKVLTNVYYIPKLKSNIVSLGQLEEAGCDIRLFDGRLKVFDPEYNLLVSAPRTVEYQDTAAGPTIHEPAGSGDVGENSGGGDAPPLSPQSPATPATPQAQPQSAGSAPAANGSPQQGSAESSEGVPLRYRSLTDLLDSTEEIHDFEYSGLCLLAADEPVNVESALTEQCWREAMNSELQAIESNNTWMWRSWSTSCGGVDGLQAHSSRSRRGDRVQAPPSLFAVAADPGTGRHGLVPTAGHGAVAVLHVRRIRRGPHGSLPQRPARVISSSADS
ncbi:unnamed protein product [Miscanthus lutarioriparius]|uniref:Retrovirus-related Pol polyprotein from transposon TNT 1-94-like beta-barrel domain-containing protein n=1 Tax=Miscanthus lutarioriparius TaxID=422564 RepID=A0A811QP24_9POAL|nr:unnamed protein product [Miscanthus lutarioriparius]